MALQDVSPLDNQLEVQIISTDRQIAKLREVVPRSIGDLAQQIAAISGTTNNRQIDLLLGQVNNKNHGDWCDHNGSNDHDAHPINRNEQGVGFHGNQYYPCLTAEFPTR